MREPKTDEKTFSGIVTQVAKKPKCTVLSMKKPTSVRGRHTQFRAFDIVRYQVLNLTPGDMIDVVYKETKNKASGKKYLKILDYEKKFTKLNHKRSRKTMQVQDSNKVGRFTSGVITSLFSSRGSKVKTKNEVCFTLKQSTNKVIYCYMSKELSQSDWFKKGQSVIMEVLEENRGITDHKTYKVITFWGKV